MDVVDNATGWATIAEASDLAEVVRTLVMWWSGYGINHADLTLRSIRTSTLTRILNQSKRSGGKFMDDPIGHGSVGYEIVSEIQEKLTRMRVD